MSIKDTSQRLAEEMLAAGATTSGETFDIKNTDDEVVVIVVRRPKRTGIEKLAEWQQRIQFQGSGTVCTCCGGSGKS